MACCNKSNYQSTCQNYNNAELPEAQFMSVDSMLAVLLKIANTGVNTLKIPSNPIASQLATVIATLAAENASLKKLMSALSPVSATETTDTVDISFGPGGAYVLRIPMASEEQRRELSKQFVKLAADLAVGKIVNPKQLPLFDN